MQFFFQELYSHIDKNSGEMFEDMFLVKIASKGTSLIFKHVIERKALHQDHRNCEKEGKTCLEKVECSSICFHS